AVEQWSRDPLTIPLHLHRTAAAFAFQITEISTWTRIHGGDQHEFRREGDTAGGAGNGHLPIFQRLSHDLEGGSLEFGQFVKKKNAVMRYAHFPWIWERPATEQ